MLLKSFFISLLFIGLCACTPSTQERYVDAVFAEIQTETHTYADTLQLDFYHAREDDLSKKPLLLLVHGGGFSGGKRDNPMEKEFSIEMAKKGYAVASISYRLTRKGKASGFGCDCPSEEKIETFKKSSEDVLRALTFLQQNEDKFQLDFNKVILVGSSAGAEAIVNAAFMRGSERYADLPYNSIHFAGVISFAGALLDIHSLNASNAVPSLFFHGKKDNLVPYATAPHHFCSKNKKGYLMLYGSKPMADKLNELGVSYTLATDPEGNHNWANLAYRRTETIAKFINEAILEGKLIQKDITLTSKQ